MTAEVAVLNLHGVALAADSAVTVTTAQTTKIWTSAEKLFHLSNSEPVGAMIYGNAAFGGHPWEVSIKEYRSRLNEASFNSIREYADDLLSFLDSEPYLSTKRTLSAARTGLAYEVLLEIREHLRFKLDELFEDKNDKLGEREVKFALEGAAKSVRALYEEKPIISGFDENVGKRTLQSILKVARQVQQHVLDKTPVTRKAQTAINGALRARFSRSLWGRTTTGLVVAGYGVEDFAPSLVNFQVECAVEGGIRAELVKSHSIGAENDAAVIPFAQSDVVSAFMEGLSPQLRNLHQTSLREAVEAIGDAIEKIPSIKSTQHAPLRKALKSVCDHLEEQWERARAAYWEPIVNNTATLPKDELAAMAESLVNLTKLRRRVSTDQETVGGPIDVAVITRGDGFIWVKRKHYFDSSINQRYLHRINKNEQS